MYHFAIKFSVSYDNNDVKTLYMHVKNIIIAPHTVPHVTLDRFPNSRDDFKRIKFARNVLLSRILLGA